MTQIEMRYLSTMPNRLAEIEQQLESLNKTMTVIAEKLQTIIEERSKQ